MKRVIYPAAAVLLLMFSGCATNDDVYVDEQEYSNMPWATPEKWEAGPAIPGLSGPGY